MKALTAVQLRRRDLTAAALAAIGFLFLLWDFRRAWLLEVPVAGWRGFLTGPICQHKISEALIAGAWMFVAVMYNHQHANLWPAWMPAARYGRVLQRLTIVMVLSLVQATYAWTVINLGTSPLTTGVEPIQANLLVWRGYLGALVLAAALFPLLLGPIAVHLVRESLDVPSIGKHPPSSGDRG